MAFIMTASVGFTTSCKKDEEESTVESEMLKREMQIEDNDFEDPAFENEADGAEVVTMPHDEKDFIGAWQAPSEQAKYLWGNINLRIKEDGTWTGNITEESFHGRWKSVTMLRASLRKPIVASASHRLRHHVWRISIISSPIRVETMRS